MEDLRYITAPSSLHRILEKTSELKFSMASEPRTGSLLRALARSKPGGAFLELGTGTGVSASWILDGMTSDATLITVDNNPQVQQIARDCLSNDPRITLLAQDGIDFLKEQPPESFDFVFADAMAGKYEDTDLAPRTIRQGGIFVIDDMLPQENWPEAHAAKVPVLMNTLAGDERFLLTPLAWASGIVLAVRK